MKKIKKFQACLKTLIVILAVCLLPLSAVSQDEGTVNAQYFYDYLSPFGIWVSSPIYGVVWVPNVPLGFRPYFTDGYWEYTDYGWMWISFYDWGWASFHYGWWAYDPDFSWIWIPGYDWAPAWVVWGYYSGYCGWAPAGPGMYNTWPYYPPCNYWVFVPPAQLGVSGWNNQYIVGSNNQIQFENNLVLTEVTNIKINDNKGTYKGTNFMSGPSMTEYESWTKTKLVPVNVTERPKPGKDELKGNSVHSYRPEIISEDKNTAQPQKIMTKENFKNREPGWNNQNEKVIKNDEKINNFPEQKIKENEPNKFQQEPQVIEQENQQYRQQQEIRQVQPESMPKRNEMKMPAIQQERRSRLPERR